MVAKWFKLADVYSKFSVASTAAAEVSAQNMARQECTENQKSNWVSMSHLIRHVTTDLLPPFEELEKNSVCDAPIIQRLLAGWLNVMEPPCRSLYANVRFIKDKPDIADCVHGKQNLLWLPEGGQRARVFVNTDKLSSRSFRSGNIGPSSWDLLPETTELLKRSLALWDRELVMGDQVTADEYQDLVGNTLSIEGKRVGVRLVRCIYITSWWNENPSPSLMARQALADRMRHSIQVQEAVYRKMDDEDDCSSLADEEEEEEQQAEEEHVQEEPPQEDKSNQIDDTPAFTKSQRKYRCALVRQWNVPGAKEPNPAMVQKWQIEKVDGKYRRV
jgi:hypothetical protein